ncbi:MAG: GAF domain-containing protein [Chloroflexi bacterium]|nr:GAF domain-containing protein [Chloroflexota bacterium]
MTSSANLPRFLQIQVTHPDEIRKGHLLQWLVILLVGMSLARMVMSVLGFMPGDTAAHYVPVIFQFVATLIFGTVCLYLIYHGRIRLAAHGFAITLIILFFLLLLNGYDNETGLLYLMLIPVVAMAALDSVRASMIYAAVNVVAIGVLTAVSPHITAPDFALFLLVTMGIGVTIWVTARELQAESARANALAVDSQQLYARTETALSEVQTLYHFNLLLAKTLDTGEVYRRAARTLSFELKANHCLILSYDVAQNYATIQIGYNQDVSPSSSGVFSWSTVSYDLGRYKQSQQVLLSGTPKIYYREETTAATAVAELFPQYSAAICAEIPMMLGAEGKGLIWLFRQQDQPTFQPDELQLAQTMANQTAVSLTNAALTSDAQVKVAQLSTINRTSLVLSHASNLKEIFEGARREIMALIPATGMSISLLDQKNNKMNWLYGYEYGQEVDLTGIPPLPTDQGFSGHVVQTRELLHVGKEDEELHQKLRTLVVGEDQAAWLGLPMIVSGELIGVLAVENDDSFQQSDIELLKIIVGPLSSTISNFIQFDEIQVALEAQFKQRIQLQTAAEVAAAAASVLELNQLVQEAVDLIKERFALYYVGLFLVDTETSKATLVAGTGTAGQKQIQEKWWLAVGEKSLIGEATGDGAPRIIQDVSQDEEWLPNPYLPETKSELALPLRVRGRVIGALTVQSATPNLFTEEMIQVLQTLCDQLGIAIENARLLARVEARAQRQETLAQISAQLHQIADVEEIVNVGLRALSEHLDGAAVSLQLGR